MTKNQPLTAQQQWLWDHLQKNQNWNCVVVYVFRIKGALNIDVLRKSFAEVNRRHESLRARFKTLGGTPYQTIDSSQGSYLRCTVVPGASDMEIDANAKRLISDVSDAPIDLAVGPLLNVKLLNLAANEHWLALAIHRLIADCSSVEIALRELWLLYEGFLLGRPSPLMIDPIQYGDYAAWQREMYGVWRRRHEPYWKERLAGAARIRWLLDRHEARETRDILGTMNSLFGNRLSTGLRELARRQRTLLANVVLAIYVAMLFRWCGQKDFVVPFNIAGRQSEHKSVIGCFSHILYLRMQLTGKETFSELVNHVGNEFFRALSHQDFGRISAQAPEMLAGTFVQWITWHLDDSLLDTSSSVGLTVERVPFRDFGEGITAIPPGLVDVEVTFFDTAKGIYVSGIYRTDVFNENMAKRFMEDLRSASEQCVRNPNVCIAEI